MDSNLDHSVDAAERDMCLLNLRWPLDNAHNGSGEESLDMQT
jgi:hypothetical protein